MSPAPRRTHRVKFGRTGRRLAPIALVLAFVLAGCSGDGDGQAAAPTATSSPHPSAAAASSTPSDADTTAELCKLVSLAALDQSFGSAVAIAKEKDARMRASVAETYNSLGRSLAQTAVLAPEALRNALTEWSLASYEVAKFVAKHKPKPGYVLEFGPSEPRWEAAKKATEKVCGHALPKR